MTTFWVDASGAILIATPDDEPGPADAVEGIVDPQPESGRQIFDFGTRTWGAVPADTRPLTSKEIEELIVDSPDGRISKADVDAKKAARRR